MIRLPTVISIALLTAIAGCASEAQGETSADVESGAREVTVTYAGCEGWGAWTLVPLAPVRAQVPPEFTIRGEDAGQAQIGMVFVTCPTFAVEGDPAPAMNYFVLFADLASHEGSYDIVEITNSAAWQGAMQIVDKASERTDEYTLTYERVDGRPVAGEATITHEGRTLRSAANPALGIPLLGPFPSDHWGKGRYGIVEADHANTFEGLGSVVMRVEFEPESPEAILLGSTTATLPGLFLGYGATAHFFVHA